MRKTFHFQMKLHEGEYLILQKMEETGTDATTLYRADLWDTVFVNFVGKKHGRINLENKQTKKKKNSPTQGCEDTPIRYWDTHYICSTQNCCPFPLSALVLPFVHFTWSYL